MVQVNGTEAGTFVSGEDWVQSLGGKEGDLFKARSEELYNFRAPRLNSELSGRLRQVGIVNGFEL